MADVTYIEWNGTKHIVKLKAGISVMEGAVKKGVPGIVAECGGSCSCATCHVYIDDAWFGKISAITEMERLTLGCAKNVKPNSRLSCQIRMTEDLDGLTVRMPESQY